MPPSQHQRKGRQQSRRVPALVPDTEIHRGNTACERKPETPSRQSQQGAALRAFPARGNAPEGLPSVHRHHNGGRHQGLQAVDAGGTQICGHVPRILPEREAPRCRAEAFREQHVRLALPHPHRRQVVYQARTDKEQPLRPVPDCPADVRRPVLPDARRAGQGVLRRPERHGTDLPGLPRHLHVPVPDRMPRERPEQADQGQHRGRLRGVHPAEDEDGTCQYGARTAQPEGKGHTGTLQGSGERPAPPVLALRLQQEYKGDTQVRGHRPQGHSPRSQDEGGRGKTPVRGGIYPYGTQDLHRQPLQAGQGPEPDSLHVGTFGGQPCLCPVPQD